MTSGAADSVVDVPMTPPEAARIVAVLVASFPYAKVDRQSAAIYTLLLRDLERDEAQQAAEHVVFTCHHFPSVQEFRDVVARRRVPMPDFAGALEEVGEHVSWSAEWADCGPCRGLGVVGPDAETVCPECRGTGQVVSNQRPALDPLVARALDLMGGPHALEAAYQTDRRETFRAQFRQLYAELRAAELLRVSFESAGLPLEYTPGFYPLDDLGDEMARDLEPLAAEIRQLAAGE